MDILFQSYMISFGRFINVPCKSVVVSSQVYVWKLFLAATFSIMAFLLDLDALNKFLDSLLPSSAQIFSNYNFNLAKCPSLPSLSGKKGVLNAWQCNDFHNASYFFCSYWLFPLRCFSFAISIGYFFNSASNFLFLLVYDL
jgi:hypothetical protein